MDLSSLKKIPSLMTTNSKIVILTGAGVSAESGIPTFRDPQVGLWGQYSPEELASPEGFRRDPKLVMDWYRWRRETVLKAEPNPAHHILAKWEQRFPHLHLITQNVDGLHTKAGSRRLIEMHGCIHRLRCVAKSHPGEWTLAPTETCAQCSALMRPDIVWFGESLNVRDTNRISVLLDDCDIFFAIGTSGLVYPAAAYLQMAASRGAYTVVINKDPQTGNYAHSFLCGSAAESLQAIDAALS